MTRPATILHVLAAVGATQHATSKSAADAKVVAIVAASAKSWTGNKDFTSCGVAKQAKRLSTKRLSHRRAKDSDFL